jgi:hypothetical protein
VFLTIGISPGSRHDVSRVLPEYDGLRASIRTATSIATAEARVQQHDVQKGFLQWDIAVRASPASLPVAGTYIKVYPGEFPPRADFEFKLNASNTLNSRMF